MDEMRSHRRMRRLAVVTTVCCLASAAQAAEPNRSFRSLIAGGWSDDRPAREASEPGSAGLTAVPKSTAEVRLADEARGRAMQPPVAQEPVAKTPSAPRQQPMRTSPALAELIKATAKTIAVPKPLAMNSSTNADLEPQVRRLDPVRQLTAGYLTVPQQESQPTVRAAEPIPVVTATDDMQLPELDPGLDAEPAGLSDPPPATVAADAGQPATVEGPIPFVLPSIQALLPLPEVQENTALLAGSLPRVDDPPPEWNSQAIRLREAARQSLRHSKQRLQRRATHSARMYAEEALRNIVAMQDALHGGNEHARQLDTALDAIRESWDFSGTLGAVEPDTLERMIAVHETDTLKHQVGSELSAVAAADAYLATAEENLVASVGNAREASEALIIIGKIERSTAAAQNAHAAAVAQTLQQAAVTIAPDSAIAYRELGATCHQQGLLNLAAGYLVESITLAPTRSAYQELLEVSRKRGDIDTTQRCVAALNGDDLPIEVPYRTISPGSFAALHRPTAAVIQRTPSIEPPADAKVQRAAATDEAESRVGLRSLLPFGRR